MKTALVALLMFAVVACGDGSFIVQFNSGTIASDPLCRNGGGRFQLLDQGGLTILVIIKTDTVIFVSSGAAGACTDLAAGAHVQVSGRQTGATITAQSVRVQSGA
ncbi:MAG: hypothetical protein HYR72_26530 [Deltaproteobacteria bacterium]|nr:hypothetical protein [Deltaproteobacteria bacterium]MBI3390428.1 hypothetical protein [Deltaproteobacteria bacterium]